MKYIQFDNDKKFDIILLGRIAIDFNPLDYYKPLSESEIFKKYIGGSPANTAVGLARLGKKCGFFSRVSDDQFGDFAINYMTKEGIDMSHVKRCTNGEKIGLTFTEILSEHESSILMYRNKVADLSLCEDDIDEEYIKQSKSLLISGCALSESPSREAALKALALAKKNNVKVIFDIDYRAYNWKHEDDIAIYYKIVASQSDIIQGSREEFDFTEKFLNLDGKDETSAAYWCKMGCKLLVIKHGKEGSTAYTNDGQKYSIKTFPVKAFKSFGGGDGYSSSFLNGIFEGWDMIDCLEHGCASASMLVSAHGCSDFMPTLKELEEFIKNKKAEYGEMIARV